VPGADDAARRYGGYGDAAGRYGYGGYDDAARRYGTYDNGDAALVAQRNTIVATPGRYPAYGSAMYGSTPGAWPATNMTNPSVYANPGYGAVAGQLGMAQQPMPYDYGGNVVTQPNAMYVNGDNVGTPQQYAAQASQIAASGSAPPDANAQWQPLGVFAMAAGGQTDPLATIQLAVNPQGALRGNFHNLSNNAIAPITGAVDPKSQRAAWTVGDDQSVVFEAGIANLTKDQTTMLVHSGDGQAQQFTLARLPEPQPGAAGSSPPGGS
jgi:hypothetical protein